MDKFKLPKENLWGQHLVIDLGNCNRDAVSSRDTIQEFCAELVKSIEMVAYGEPIIEHFATHLPSAAGYSLVQLIETSNISAHFVELTGDAYIDILSCAEFEESTAIAVCVKYFSPDIVNPTVLYRGV